MTLLITRFMMMFNTLLLCLSLFFTVNTPVQASVDSREASLKITKFHKYKDEIYHASQVTGVDMEILTSIASIESGFNPKAVNRANKHRPSGLLQQINGTWVSQKKRFAKKVGVSKNASRHDVRANLLVGGMDLSQAKPELIKRTQLTHKTVQAGDIYMTWFLGMDAAVKVINANPNAPIGKYVKISKANLPLFTKKGKQLTVKQFRQHLNNKMQKEITLYQTSINHYQMDKFVERLNLNTSIVLSQRSR